MKINMDNINMFLSKLGYSELVQRLFEKMTFSLVDPLTDNNQQWTKSGGGYGDNNGDNDSDDGDNQNVGDGGGGGSLAAR